MKAIYSFQFQQALNSEDMQKSNIPLGPSLKVMAKGKKKKKQPQMPIYLSSLLS